MYESQIEKYIDNALNMHHRMERHRIDRDFMKTLCVDHCHMCGSHIHYKPLGKCVDKAEIKRKATLDRIKPGNLGGEYTNDNIMIICLGCNSIKGDLYKPDDIMEFMKARKKKKTGNARKSFCRRMSKIAKFMENYIELKEIYNDTYL